MAFLRVEVENSTIDINNVSYLTRKDNITLLVMEEKISVVGEDFIMVDGCKFYVGKEKAKAIEKWLTRPTIEVIAENKTVFELKIEQEAKDATYFVG